MLTGKGAYIWKINEAEGGDIAELVGKAKVAGMTHLIVKIAEADGGYNYTTEDGDMAKAFADECKKNGIEPWGYQYVYGYNPLGEAKAAVRRVSETGVVGFVIDAEKEYKHKNAEAVDYMAGISSIREDGIPVALASYRYPVKYHPELPWKEFLSKCDLVMPQTYWPEGDPVANLAGMLDDYDRLWEALQIELPIVPTGSAYSEHGWTATDDEVQRFLEACEQVELPGVNFWRWEQMKIHGLWPTIRDYSWPVVEEPIDPEPIDEIELLQEKITAIEERIVSLEENVQLFLEEGVLWEHLDPRLKSISERLSENQAKISALQTKADDIARIQNDHSLEITDLQSQDEMLKKNIANVLDDANEEIGYLEKGIISKVEELMKRDSEINQRITEGFKDIASSIVNVSQEFEEEIDRLDKKIDNLPSDGSGNYQDERGFFYWLRKLIS